MAELAYKRADGNVLYITIDGRKGQAWFTTKAGDVLIKPTVTFGPKQTDALLHAWDRGEVTVQGI